MSDVLLDTQKMVERLQDAGVAQAQARAHTDLLVETITEHCASKEDLAKMEAHVNARFDKLQANTDARFDKLQITADARFSNLEARITAETALLRAAISDTRSDPMRWVVTVGILQMALIIGLVLKLT